MLSPVRSRSSGALVRAAENKDGSLGPAVQWSYYADGQLRERRDQQGQPVQYRYDADNKLVFSHDASGLTTSAQTFVDTQNVYDDLDRLTRSDLKKQADASWTFSSFAYDPNSNLSDQEQNGLESAPGGSLVKAGRKLHSDYDGADWLATQLDFGTDPGAQDDQRTLNQFTPIGLEQRREIDKSDGAGGFTPP